MELSIKLEIDAAVFRMFIFECIRIQRSCRGVTVMFDKENKSKRRAQ